MAHILTSSVIVSTFIMWWGGLQLQSAYGSRQAKHSRFIYFAQAGSRTKNVRYNNCLPHHHVIIIHHKRPLTLKSMPPAGGSSCIMPQTPFLSGSVRWLSLLAISGCGSRSTWCLVFTVWWHMHMVHMVFRGQGVWHMVPRVQGVWLTVRGPLGVYGSGCGSRSTWCRGR